MSEAQLDKFRQALAASTRALAGAPRLIVDYAREADAPLVADPTRAKLPSFQELPQGQALTQLRAAGDRAAASARYHDAGLHRQLQPLDNADAFNQLEAARVALLAARLHAGVARNLSAELHSQPVAAAARDLIAQLWQEAVPRDSTGVDFTGVNATGANGPPPLQTRDIAPLLKALPDQRAFAKAALAALRQAPAGVEQTAGETPDQPAEAEAPEPGAESHAADEAEAAPDDEGGEAEQSNAQLAAAPEGQLGEQGGEPPPATDPDPDPWAESDAAAPEETRAGATLPYRVYTTAFDEIAPAERLAQPGELSKLRGMLDQQLQPMQGLIARLAHRLQRQLLAQQTRSWNFDREEGLVDAARLPRLIMDSAATAIYKRESDTPFRDTIVTLLIDNSGSMRGRPITTAALSADILARTLERCGVRTEILGFTTRSWKGGRAREAWQAAAVNGVKPPLPGRLNELRHIVYKAADAPYARARKNLGLLLREGLLKENIDGEALLWAAQRLLKRPERRRVLMVISDGAPVDDATLAANPGGYLEAHLKAVIGWIETQTPLELTAIGIGHDVTRYYKRAVKIADAESLGPTMLAELGRLFGRR